MQEKVTLDKFRNKLRQIHITKHLDSRNIFLKHIHIYIFFFYIFVSIFAPKMICNKTHSGKIKLKSSDFCLDKEIHWLDIKLKVSVLNCSFDSTVLVWPWYRFAIACLCCLIQGTHSVNFKVICWDNMCNQCQPMFLLIHSKISIPALSECDFTLDYIFLSDKKDAATAPGDHLQFWAKQLGQGHLVNYEEFNKQRLLFIISIGTVFKCWINTSPFYWFIF